jgi:hypothetical protein
MEGPQSVNKHLNGTATNSADFIYITCGVEKHKMGKDRLEHWTTQTWGRKRQKM